VVASITIRYLGRNINATKVVRRESIYIDIDQSLTIGVVVLYKGLADSGFSKVEVLENSA
jgi:hypothetical protein